MKGTIKWYNEEKGYGFIKSDETSEEMFFHKTGIEPGFKPFEGGKVEFDEGEGRKGPKAVNVRGAN